MIDYGKIGRRIAEERKYIHKISQEKMAEELGMYQADISNMEKAKKSSGINDLSKLDMIADYLGIPLETLLFGREDKNMLKYEGSKMTLKQSSKKLTRSQKTILDKIAGHDTDELPIIKYECGPYLILTMMEKQEIFGNNSSFDENGNIINPEFGLHKPHTYVFFGGELIAAMSAALTNVMQHVYEPSLRKLQQLIQFDVLDVTDVWRTLNPYWALWNFSDDDDPEAESYRDKMFTRMDELRESGEERYIIYIESIFVREDCRRNGICRMYIDLLKKLSMEDPIIWMNMEPTAGGELDREYDYYPTYTIADIGQLNLNASIAEHLGFTVDPDTWHRQSEVIDAYGNTKIEPVLIRKCAYYLPARIREIIKQDGDLVALGRAKQKLIQAETDAINNSFISNGVDLRTGVSGPFKVIEWGETEDGITIYIYAAVSDETPDTYRFGVSKRSVIEHGLDHEDQVETFDFLDDALESKYFDQYFMLLNMLGAGNLDDDSEENIENEL